MRYVSCYFTHSLGKETDTYFHKVRSGFDRSLSSAGRSYICIFKKNYFWKLREYALTVYIVWDIGNKVNILFGSDDKQTRFCSINVTCRKFNLNNYIFIALFSKHYLNLVQDHNYMAYNIHRSQGLLGCRTELAWHTKLGGKQLWLSNGFDPHWVLNTLGLVVNKYTKLRWK